MKNETGTILYVGKAKSLRKRLSSYFRAGANLTPKTRALVGRVRTVETLLTATEKEALLLEESLIKKHRPRYNIVLRDDKGYILFRLDKRSDYPRLSITRRTTRDGSVFFGPFTSAQAARETWKLIGRVFPLRKCRDHAFRNRVRPCLYHDMGRCLAPCVKDVSRDDYLRVVSRVEMLLAGRSRELTGLLRKEMDQASERLEFERAAILRDQIRALERTVEKQSVVLSTPRDLDVAALAEVSGGLALGLLFIREGRLVSWKGFRWPDVNLGDGPEVMGSFLGQFYTPSRLIPARILVSVAPYDDALSQVLADRRGAGVAIVTARTGAEKNLLEIARRNALAHVEEQADDPLPELLGRKLGLGVPVHRIECVDISHLGGEGTCAGLVVFEDGVPRNSDYRIYSLPESEGTGDDYLALAEWVRRRLESGPPWPDLLLVDGGRGQLGAVVRAMEDAGAPDRFAVASIAKGGRRAGELEDRIFRPGRKNPLSLRSGSRELLFLQRVRDAAHRFVIGRQRRGKRSRALTSDLMSLGGIGPKTARLLWDAFGSLEAMRRASVADLEALPGIGSRKASRIAESLATLSANVPGSK